MHAKNSRWQPILNFGVHVVVGTSIFLLTGLPAVGLSLLIHRLDALGVAHFTITALTALECFILLVDTLAVAAYLAITSYREIKEMLDE